MVHSKYTNTSSAWKSSGEKLDFEDLIFEYDHTKAGENISAGTRIGDVF